MLVSPAQGPGIIKPASGLFFPYQLDDLILHYDAEASSSLLKADDSLAADGDAIATWKNLASASNDAAQSNNNNRPSLDVDGSFNQFRTVVFDSNDVLNIPAGALGSFTELDVFIVGGCESLEAGVEKRIFHSWISSPNFMFILSKTTSDGYRLNYSTNGSNVFALNSTEPAVADVDHIFNFYTDASGTGFSVDGETFVTGAGTIYNGGTSPIEIGHAFTSQDIHQGEIIVFDRKLTANERAQVNNYLQAKWGFL